jgi:hypothetical protein
MDHQPLAEGAVAALDDEPAALRQGEVCSRGGSGGRESFREVVPAAPTEVGARSVDGSTPGIERFAVSAHDDAAHVVEAHRAISRRPERAGQQIAFAS